MERPGITGSKLKRARDSAARAEPAAETPSNAHPGVETGEPTNRPQSGPSTPTARQSTVETDPKTKAHGETKRMAEDDADDSERGDRKNWRNYVEPASSNAATGSQVATTNISTDAKGTKRETQEEEERKGKKTARSGGVKRTAEEEADDSERAERRSRADDDLCPATQGVDTSMASDPASDKRELAAPAEENGSPQKTQNKHLLSESAVQTRREKLPPKSMKRSSKKWPRST